jgi:hypothetical protein
VTPQERAVIAAARAEVASGEASSALTGAVERLDATADRTEHPLTYGQIVTTDEVWSDAKQKWFEVLETTRRGDRVHFRLVGVAARFDKPAGDPVKVRRSEMGKAMDLFGDVIWSGVSKG